ncbi:MAG: glycosyl hydrolase [Ruminococcaceae bacterium]|nr:glycosyl hydrolase [Oscillospiraceae bacterium]
MIHIFSTEQARWQTGSAVSPVAGSPIAIGEPVGKPLFGWGCCISEICVSAIFSLPEAQQKEIFDALFGEEGCGFSYCRLSIGANDFAESWYSYNETEGDYAMEHFSIERDEKYILPAVREAMKRSPALQFFASPWSPPTWMKFPKVYNYGRLVQTEENRKAYALYFRKFLEAYKEKGVKIHAVCPQNEFFADQKFPSCLYSPAELEAFLCDLAEEVKGLAEVYYGTCNGPDPYSEDGLHGEYLGYLMENPKLKNAITGAAYQWNGKFAVMQAKEDYPHLDVIQSECQCGDGKNSWQYAMYTLSMIHHYTVHGARANVYWNMALPKDGVSSWGWKQNSLVSVTEEGYVFNPEFYVMKHFAHFVKPGAVLLQVSGEMSSNTTVFRNPDGTTAAVVANPFPFEKVVTIGGENRSLKPRSFNTFVW